MSPHRCARNCFQCPQCVHTLSVVASDPDPSIPLNTAAASVGEPPYFLTCTFCGWNSKEVGITFEKPTGLARELREFSLFSFRILNPFDPLQSSYRKLKKELPTYSSSITSKIISILTFVVHKLKLFSRIRFLRLLLPQQSMPLPLPSSRIFPASILDIPACLGWQLEREEQEIKDK